MCPYYSHFLLILLSSITVTLAKRTYIFKIDVSAGSCLCYPSTPDQLYFRLCNNALCTTFTSLPNGLNGGTLYTYYITTPYDYGNINKVQIIHTGDDQVCLDWVEVDGNQWDYGLTPYCYDSGDTDARCKTLTVTSSNDWSTSTTNPCEFASAFDDTYQPSPMPTQPTRAPTNPSKAPTKSPTPAPTNIPTTDPTVDPTHDPTHDPTKDPTNDPTNDPTKDPTSDPTTDPTAEPTKSTIGPTTDPTLEPTAEPTYQPTLYPTQEPTKSTKSPTFRPTKSPTLAPTAAPFGSANVDTDTNDDGDDNDDDNQGSDKNGDDLQTGDSNGNSVGLLMGIVFGALFCCTLLILIIFCCYTRKKQQKQTINVNQIMNKHGMQHAQQIPDASPMPGDGNPTTFSHAVMMAKLPPAPMVMTSINQEGGETGTAGNFDEDDEDDEVENVLPESVSSQHDEEVIPVGADNVNDDDDDMYVVPVDIADIKHDNKATDGQDIEMMYQQPSEETLVGTVSYMGSIESMGSPSVMSNITDNNNNNDDHESDGDDEMNEMYNKQRSTKGNRIEMANIDGDSDTDNIYED